jgi:hypothetical protein
MTEPPQPPYQPPNPYGPDPYGQNQYPQYPQYGAPQPTQPPATQPPATTRAGQLGARVQRRPDARFGPAIAAAGAALVLAGVLVWSVGYFIAGFHLSFGSGDDFTPSASGDGRRFLGAGLFLVVAVAGYVLVVLRRRGPLATAGVVAGAAGVPLALTFAFLDVGGIFTGQDPVNVDAVVLISIVVWLASYFVIPGAKGHAVYLGLAATFVYTYAAFKADGNSLIRTGFSIGSGSGSGGLGGTGATDTGTVAALGLVFGLGYYAIAAFLDHRGRAGVAIAFVFAAFGATVGGLTAAANSFGQVGGGVALLIVSAALCWYGGYFGRRFTTWIWAAGFAVGVGVIVDKITPHSYTGGGILLIVIGLLVAAGAAFAASAAHEPLDLDDAPTGPVPVPSPPGAAGF